MDAKKYIEKLKSKDNFKDGNEVERVFQELFRDFMREAMESEMDEHLGYKRHERSDSENARNGYSKKKIKSGIGGEIELDIPRDRKSEYDPKLITKNKGIFKDLEDKIVALYARGNSTRDISDAIEEMYGMSVSASTISDITDRVIPLISEWQSRSLNEVYPIVFFDAMHCKVKKDGKIINKAVYICLGIDSEGMKDLLGMWIGDGSEGAKYWLSVFTELKNRGVQDILIACMDGLKGLPEAVKSIFPNTEIQLCIVHQIRNSSKYVSWKHKKELAKDLKTIYQAPSEESAYENLQEFKKKWDPMYPMIGRSWEANWGNLSGFFKYPAEIRRIIYTTNALEGLNRQLRKYTKTKAVFTSDQALMKCLYLAQEIISKKWTMPIRDWGLCLSQLAIHFEGRIH